MHEEEVSFVEGWVKTSVEATKKGKAKGGKKEQKKPKKEPYGFHKRGGG
jgi:hypothetical protein